MRKSLIYLSPSKRRQLSIDSHHDHRSSMGRPFSNLSNKKPSELFSSIEESPQGKTLKEFYRHELLRLDKELDAYEIQLKNSPENRKNSLETYQQYLKNLAMCIKQKDVSLGSRVLRAVIAYGKILKHSENSKETVVHIMQKSKETRDNLTQTHEGVIITEEIYPDTNKEMQFIKSLIEKIDNLRGSKISSRLYELHENLCQLNTEIPTPTETPEPYDKTIGLVDQKFHIFYGLLRHEISKSLRKNNINIVKYDKNIQANVYLDGLVNDPVKEKVLEIINLKSQIEHIEKEQALLKDNLAKTRNLLQTSERKNEEMNLELIQFTNKFRTLEDTLKNAKQKVVYFTDRLALKKKRARNVKNILHEKEKSMIYLSESLKKSNDKNYSLSVTSKISEEKIIQLEAAYKSISGKEFDYSNISSIEIASKYNIYKAIDLEAQSVEIESAKTFENYMKRANTVRAETRTSMNPSPKISPKLLSQKTVAVGDENFTITTSGVTLRPLVREDYVFSPAFSEDNFDTVPNASDNYAQSVALKPKKMPFLNTAVPLTTIIEQSPRPGSEKLMIPCNTGQANFSQATSNWVQEVDNIPISSQDKNISNPVIQRPLNRRIFVDRIRTNIIKENNELNSPGLDYLNSNPKTPLLKSLINEHELLIANSKKNTQEKIINAEENSKVIQCTLLSDPLSPNKRSFKRTFTSPRKKNSESIIIDDQTMENLQDLNSKSGSNIFKDPEEFDLLPTGIQIEIIKSMEGHDSKKCDDECIHLKRALAMRHRERGVPYPIKTLLINSRIE